MQNIKCRLKRNESIKCDIKTQNKTQETKVHHHLSK